MSHLVESMFYRDEVPWHGLGKKVTEDVTTAEAIQEAGLDWRVTAAPLYTGPDHGQKKVKHRAIMRETDQQVLGVVGPNYVPLQNEAAFNFFDPYVSSGQAILDTAGSLSNGQTIWVLARLNRAPIEVVKNDVVEKYLLLSNSHRGGVAVRVGFTPIRVVCANTLAMSHGHGKSQLMRVTHGREVKENLEKIQEVVNAADAQFEATAEQYRFLASRQVNKHDLQKFVKLVFQTTGDANERAMVREKKMTDTITRLFETGRGNAQSGVAGTYWALYNAATEYISHEAQKNDERRMNSLWFGSNSNINNDALKVAVEMAE